MKIEHFRTCDVVLLFYEDHHCFFDFNDGFSGASSMCYHIHAHTHTHTHTLNLLDIFGSIDLPSEVGDSRV